MPTVNVDKEDIHIIRTDDKGNVLASTVTGNDVVVSVPTIGYKKIVNIYYDIDNNKLIVVYEGD